MTVDMKRAIGLAAIWLLVACSAGHPAVPTSSGSSWQALQPDHAPTALPGATLPCGFPKHGSVKHVASCPMAINVHIPANRNPHLPVSKIPGLHPADIVAAYGFPSTNAGALVAIVDAYDDPMVERDLGRYRAEFGISACTTANGCFKKVNQRGEAHRYPRASRTWSQEIALDVEMVSAVCPNCSILLVEANSASIDDLGASVDEAVKLGATIVSNSYYATEWTGETLEDVHYNHPGVAIVASSGDKVSPYYPAASPYVTAVGGTTLAARGASWTQTAWAYGGQGCSAFEPLPSFQPSTFCSTRSTVDMAVIGDPQTGVAAFTNQSGGWIEAGGTSVGAPIVAAAYALSANPQSPAFSYAHAADFTDIAPAGFDLATGLGSPNGVSGL